MILVYRYLFHVMWFGWFTYWHIAARSAKPILRHESRLSRFAHLGPLFASFLLLAFSRLPIPYINARFMPQSAESFWIGAAVTAIGLLFSVWARVYLGKNWSATVAIKDEHKLITGGPYALARHPIYTGLLLGIFGSAIATGKWCGVIAVVLATLSLWRKWRLEEKYMLQEFGNTYETYKKRVAALIPYVL